MCWFACPGSRQRSWDLRLQAATAAYSFLSSGSVFWNTVAGAVSGTEPSGNGVVPHRVGTKLGRAVTPPASQVAPADYFYTHRVPLFWNTPGGQDINFIASSLPNPPLPTQRAVAAWNTHTHTSAQPPSLTHTGARTQSHTKKTHSPLHIVVTVSG